jgi:hypothetical protein
VSAVERIRSQLGENCPGKRPGDDVAGVVDAGVDARVGDERGKTMKGYRGRRGHSSDPARKGERGRRVARWERGRDRHPRLSRHWNLIGDAVWPSAAPEGLQAEVDDDSRYPDRRQTAQGRATASPPAGDRNDRRRANRQLGVIGSAGEAPHRGVESGGRCSRDRGVNCKINALGVAKPTRSRDVGFCGRRGQDQVIL